ncbi:MAG: UDP-N-acetylmuramoyl-L-alanine--D-glutamate ligase [Nitrospirae bacterium]|nr:UDP-N-acetylmuramoyl-L-alanine--D-glutamate ligase [Nitrospirota bacterium]
MERMIVVDEKKMTFKDKNIVVVGLARSGTGAANLLSELGANVTITDNKQGSLLENNIKRLLPSIKVVTGSNPSEVFDTAEMIVISPGVPLTVPSLERARAKGIPIIGELELAYQVIQGLGIRDQGLVKNKSDIGLPTPFIGITGTNGKSTVTTLVDLMLKEAGFNSLLGGNIGIALTEEMCKIVGAGLKPDSALPDYIVTEISSFQLETIKDFRPKIATILNITPDHLDRYKGMDEYIDAKARVFENQTPEDFLVLNADDPELEKVGSEKLEVRGKEKPGILYFSRKKEVEGIYLKDGIVYCDLLSFPASYFPLLTFRFSLISQDEIKIQGVHNIENAMAASLIALISGCSIDSVRNVLKTFPGLEHRLEFVADIGGVKFINDSKGTNVGAVAKSLEGFDNLILIMGGLDKGGEFTGLRDLVRRKVKALVLIGKAKDKIASALGDAAETLMAEDLNSAVELSLSKASAGDVVLLSPGCASFDMFKDFEDRGRKFKDAVNQLKVKSEKLRVKE